MNIDQISPSILHVTAKENLNIQDDLNKTSDKTISQLLHEETQKTDQNQNQNQAPTNS